MSDTSRSSEARGARLATGAWESLFRAQVVLEREFADDDIWGDLTRRDYDVLYTLSKSPDGLRMTEINERIMLTQPGISRLIARLEHEGLVARRPDPDDARAQRIGLTDAGREVQRAVGRPHVRQIVRAMTRALDAEQMRQLQQLCDALVAGAEARARAVGAPAGADGEAGVDAGAGTEIGSSRDEDGKGRVR